MPGMVRSRRVSFLAEALPGRRLPPDLVRLWQTLGRIAQPHVLRGSLAYNPMAWAMCEWLPGWGVWSLVSPPTPLPAYHSARCDVRSQSSGYLAGHPPQSPPEVLGCDFFGIVTTMFVCVVVFSWCLLEEQWKNDRVHCEGEGEK